MRFPPRSITGSLVTWLFSGTAMVLTIAAVFLHSEVRKIVIGSMDTTLHSKRQMITGLLHEEHGGIEFELSHIITGEYEIPRSGHYYKIIMDGGILAASPSLVNDNFIFLPVGAASVNGLPGESTYTSTGPDDEPVRVLQYQYHAFKSNFEITLAESLSDGISMIDTFRRTLLVVIPTVIVVLCFAAWRIVKTSLRPIEDFSKTVETITHENLSDRVHTGETAYELARLAQSFNAMLDRLNTVFESQKRLVADASHELKTPISVIRTQCDVVLQRVRTPGEYIDALQTIQSSSRGMTKLINDLLSLARLDAGLLAPTDFTVVSLKKCITHAIAMTAQPAEERRVAVSASIDDTLRVLGSSIGLSEAFLNLLENAVKYNVEGGSVRICAFKDNGKAVITIGDTGMGIREGDSARIFERFYRADKVRNMEGTGLGLSIVKSVVEAHNGEIAVQSEPDQGSKFTITFPLAGERPSSKNPLKELSGPED